MTTSHLEWSLWLIVQKLPNGTTTVPRLYNHCIANPALECTNIAMEGSYEAPEDCSRNFVYSWKDMHIYKPSTFSEEAL